MKINPIITYSYNTKLSRKQPYAVAAKPACEVSFQSRVLTKICGTLGVITAAAAIIGTGGAAAVILPALGFAGVTTAAGYAMDKDNERDEAEQNEDKNLPE